jgi:alpha-beta hydrolase superfamily lysophospholipase
MGKINCAQGNFTGKGNVEIFFRKWVADRPKVNVVIVHGLGDHSGRYSNLIETCAGKSISFFSLDNRGHGQSKGVRGHANSFMDYIFDLKMFINTIRKDYPSLPLILLGQGFGGTIACRYALTYQNDLSGLILTSPGFIPTITIPFLKNKCMNVLSSMAPSIPISYGFNPLQLSHDQAAVAGFSEDPMVHTSITPRLYTEYLENAAFCLDHSEQLRIPLLILHGEEDHFCSPKGSAIVFEHVSSEDKILSLLPGLYHEIMNEDLKPRTKVLAAISKWIVSHSRIKTSRKTAPAQVKTKPAAKKQTKPAAKGKKSVGKKI